MRSLTLTFSAVTVIAAALFGAFPSAAHHGWSSYQAEAVKISAPIKAVRYQNPHGEIEVEYDGATWVVVLAPVSRMQARGLPAEALTEGKPVEVEAYPIKSGEKEMRAERITVDGKTVELR